MLTRSTRLSYLRNFISVILLLLGSNALRAQKIEILQQGKPTSIRGLSVVDDKTAWISGSKGYVATTTDAGKTWNWQQVKGYEQADFRDIEAFSDKEAIIMSSGTPALILKTIDGGATWDLKYKNDDKAYFLDAMAFHRHNEGMILGDPIDGKFLILQTKDGGDTWKIAENPPAARKDEAAFAASGTCLIWTGRAFTFVTGGSIARLIVPLKKVRKRDSMFRYIPVLHGKSSEGAFSQAVGAKQVLVVGGDYSHDHRTDSVAAYYGGRNSAITTGQPSGYQSCVIFLKDKTFLSTGTPGTNITTDGGQLWQQIDANSFNVCQKAKKGNLILFAGDRGKIAVFRP